MATTARVVAVAEEIVVFTLGTSAESTRDLGVAQVAAVIMYRVAAAGLTNWEEMALARNPVVVETASYRTYWVTTCTGLAAVVVVRTLITAREMVAKVVEAAAEAEPALQQVAAQGTTMALTHCPQALADILVHMPVIILVVVEEVVPSTQGGAEKAEKVQLS